jgi:hypothetical protein
MRRASTMARRRVLPRAIVKPAKFSANVRASLEKTRAELRTSATKGMKAAQRPRLQGVTDAL